MEQMGQEPVEEEIPPDWEDFPNIAIDGINIFNGLGDRMYPDIGFVGKDFTNLKTYIEIYQIPDYNRELLLDILLFLEHHVRKDSQDTLKREREKLKSKSKAKK